MSINITPEDVGRKVRLRDGAIGTIIGYRRERLFPYIIGNEYDYDNVAVCANGYFLNALDESPWDVVAWADEPPKTTITFTPSVPNIADYPWPPTTHRDTKTGQSQCEMVLAHLRMFGRITPQEALDQYGCFRLAARISDLRERGHRIETLTERRGRKSWAVYRLEGV